MNWQQRTQKVIELIEERRAEGKGFTPKEIKEMKRLKALACRIMRRIKSDEEEAQRRFSIYEGDG
jgi:hypothetical protein